MSTTTASPIADDLTPITAQRRDSFPAILFRVPWWLLILFLLAIWAVVLIQTDQTYQSTFNYVRDGVTETLLVAAGAYPLAMLIGLLIGIVRANPPKPGYGPVGFALSVVRLFVYQLCTLYVAIIRGLPIVVALLVVAFIIVPSLREVLNTSFGIVIPPRIYRETAIVSLAVAYAAFLSETFRAGIQSIERGQIEAARSLGMGSWQVISLIVLPQAIRRILPPLGKSRTRRSFRFWASTTSRSWRASGRTTSFNSRRRISSCRSCTCH
jgi:polar amino acid transport system permease protein